MTRRVSGTLDLAATIRLFVGDDPAAMVHAGSEEETAMSGSKFKPWWRRLKSETKWPHRLRNPRLLKWAFYVGGMSCRLWRFWNFFFGPGDG